MTRVHCWKVPAASTASRFASVQNHQREMSIFGLEPIILGATPGLPLPDL